MVAVELPQAHQVRVQDGDVAPEDGDRVRDDEDPLLGLLLLSLEVAKLLVVAGSQPLHALMDALGSLLGRNAIVNQLT